MIEKNTPLYGKRTLIVGVSEKKHGYATMALERLQQKDHDVVLLGRSSGNLYGIVIHDIRTTPSLKDIHTITLYINPTHQKEWYSYLIGLKPVRIIFNPGTENSEFAQLARENGIEVVYGCTLVMLSVGTY